MRPVNWSSPINWSHPLNKGLVSWHLVVPHWSGGKIFYDLTKKYDGTLINMDLVTDWIGPSGRPGGWGALLFDGDNGGGAHVNVASMPVISQPFTVLGWFKHLNDFREMIVDHNAGDNTGWRIQTGASGNADTLTFTLGGVAEYNFSNLAIGGDWHFFAVSVSGTTAVGYLDNVSQSVTIGTQVGTPDRIDFGHLTFAPSTFELDGLIDDIRIYNNRALSPAEVSQYYQLSRQFYPGLLNRLRRRAVKTPAAPSGPITGRHYPRGVMRGEMRGVA